jgi:hypothetical protein
LDQRRGGGGRAEESGEEGRRGGRGERREQEAGAAQDHFKRNLLGRIERLIHDLGIAHRMVDQGAMGKGELRNLREQLVAAEAERRDAQHKLRVAGEERNGLLEELGVVKRRLEEAAAEAANMRARLGDMEEGMRAMQMMVQQASSARKRPASQSPPLSSAPSSDVEAASPSEQEMSEEDGSVAASGDERSGRPPRAGGAGEVSRRLDVVEEETKGAEGSEEGASEGGEVRSRVRGSASAGETVEARGGGGAKRATKAQAVAGLSSGRAIGVRNVAGRETVSKGAAAGKKGEAKLHQEISQLITQSDALVAQAVAKSPEITRRVFALRSRAGGAASRC